MTWDAATPPWSNLLRLRPLSAAVALTATAALALTGCGGSSGSGNGNGSGKAASAVTNQVNPVDRSKLTSGGDLRWALEQIPANFNYNQLDGTLIDTAQVENALL